MTLSLEAATYAATSTNKFLDAVRSRAASINGLVETAEI